MWAYLLRTINVPRLLLPESDKLLLLFASIVRFRGVKIVRPFCYRIITFFVIYKSVIEVVEKVKRIVDAILWNREMLSDFSVHDNNSGEVVFGAVTIVARFPSFIERIPCSLVINKGRNVEHLTHPIVCHIDVGICVINEGNHLPHDVIPGGLHFGRD